jgi:uncharacterized protein
VADLPRSRFATGSAITGCLRQIGAVLGVAALIAFTTRDTGAGAPAVAAFHTAWWLMTVTGLATAACALGLPRSGAGAPMTGPAAAAATYPTPTAPERITVSTTDSTAPTRSRSRRDRRLLRSYGPSALVTGASSGIGQAIAGQLAAAGFDLVLVARREAVLDQLADRLRERAPVTVRVLPADLGAPDGLDRVATATAGTDIGLCVAAAGYGTSGPLLDSALEVEVDMLRVNCEAVLRLCHVFGRRLVARGRGGLILMSSIVGFQGTPWAGHYAATKAYVQSLAEALHVELAPSGVDVLAAAPGPTHSGFADRAGMTMGRALTSDAVARGTLDALGRRPTAHPGALSRLLKDSLAPLPRRVRVRIMAGVMSGMVVPPTGPAAPSSKTGTP